MDSCSISASSVCAVVVTYFPDDSVIENMRLLAKEVGEVVIVDNGSQGASSVRLDRIQTEIPCTVIRNPQNLGVAAALNIGFRTAVHRGCEWLLALDQDSTVSNRFVNALLETANASPGAGIICPTYIARVSSTIMAMPKTASGDLLTTMTSGSLLRSSTFIKAGPFDERLFIDSVDNEYCLRIRAMGMRIVQSKDALLTHSLGAASFRKFFGRKLVATNHSPARRYYMTRNRLLLIAHYPRDLSWLYFDFREMFRDLLAVLLVEEDKLAKLRFMVKGALDCARGRWGMQVPL